MIKILEKIGNGESRVLIGYPIEVTEKLKEIIKNNKVTLFFIGKEFYSKFYNSLPQILTAIGKIIPAYNLDNALKSQKYRSIMQILLDAIKNEKITHVLLNSNMWHPNYLSELKKNNLVITTKIVDDPEGSKYYSEPIVQYYDKCICSGIDYNKNYTIEDMYYKWGAKDVKFLPVFVDPRHYDEHPIDYAKKDIDIIHVGSFNWKRWIYLSKLYKNFGNNIRFYSHYDPRNSKNINGLIYKIINFIFPLPQVEKVSDEKLKEIYKRSKIGFNKHLSYGPSNARSYELCLNGVLQVTDNPKGYKNIYFIEKEIICYKNIKEAIRFIRLYLKSDIERERIARAGHEKAIKEYTYEKILDKHLEYILGK